MAELRARSSVDVWPSRVRALLLVLCLPLMVSVEARATFMLPPIFRECPHCTAAVADQVIASMNNIGSTGWTDGFTFGPMLVDRVEIVKCRRCERAFWLEDAREIEPAPEELVDDSRDDGSGVELPWPIELSESEYLAAASEPNLARERERHARIRAWWLANDRYRYNPYREVTVPFPGWSAEQARSLARLAALLDERDELDRLYKAEIARELRQFERCLKLLEYPLESVESVARIIRRLARRGEARVAIRYNLDPSLERASGCGCEP